MDIDKILAAAELVKLKRAELEEAEAALTSALRGSGSSAKSAAPQGGRGASTRPNGGGRSNGQLSPVTQRVAKFLAQHPDGSEFGVVVAAVQPATTAAVKSALNGLRAKQQATFRNGKYAPKENASRGLPRRRQVSVEQSVT
jgi:hypothetical protein